MKREIIAILVVIGIAAIDAQAFPWRFKRKQANEDSTESTQPEESVQRKSTFLDTLNQGRELRLSEGDLGVTPVSETREESASVTGREVPNGFRVQCFASSQVENARAEKALLETRIRYPVYLVFESPYYKLAVGDFTTRDQANAASAELKKQGYQDAWVVGSKVLVKK